MKPAFVFFLALVFSLKVGVLSASEGSGDHQQATEQTSSGQVNSREETEKELYIGPERRVLTPLSVQEFDTMAEQSRKLEWRRDRMKFIPISVGVHGAGSFLFLIGWGMKALSTIDWDLVGHDTDDEDEDDFATDTKKEPSAKQSMPEDVYRFGVIGLPLVSGLLVFVVSGMGTYVGNRSLWSRTRYFPIACGGVIGWGLNTGLMFLLAEAKSEEAFVIVPTLGSIIFPVLGELLGYLVARKETELPPMRLRDHEDRHRSPWSYSGFPPR